MSQKTVFVTHKQYDAALNRIMNANLKTHGKSLSLASMRGNGIIVDIQDDRKGMMVIADWRNELKRRYLKPEGTPQSQLQDTLLRAVERTKKTRRSHHVVRFIDDTYQQMRFRIYPDGKLGESFQDCAVGERINYLGCTNRHNESSHPIPFWPENHFKDEYSELPLVREYEIYLYGKPYKEWIAEREVK